DCKPLSHRVSSAPWGFVKPGQPLPPHYLFAVIQLTVYRRLQGIGFKGMIINLPFCILTEFECEQGVQASAKPNFKYRDGACVSLSPIGESFLNKDVSRFTYRPVNGVV